MTIIVTGGTKGIGLAIARRLAQPGETLVLVYQSDDDAAAKAKTLVEEVGATAHSVRADIGTIAGAAAVMDAAAEIGGPITCLVHSAAMIYPTTLLEADLERFTQAIQTNGLSLLYLVQKALPLMTKESSVVFISSAGARNAAPRYGALQAAGESSGREPDALSGRRARAARRRGSTPAGPRPSVRTTSRLGHGRRR